ncbi:hypothetical protein HAX54_000230 [Datura stramonium]|uniref:Uncharacterized protein n=1 Tax=Datura stramonium TaxID=4076 RepID=A0ABS8T1P1_DATST|nr:hypothetical protein [Datura stramonium]
MPSSLREPPIGLQIYPVHLGIQSELETHLGIANIKHELPASFRSQSMYLGVNLTLASHPVKLPYHSMRRRSFTDPESGNLHSIMSTSRQPHKGKESMSNSNTPSLSSKEAQRIMLNLFGLARMEKYYVSFKEKRSIHTKAHFEVESFKNAFPDIYYQIGMRDWGPFTIYVDPYFSELVWEFYASYKA